MNQKTITLSTWQNASKQFKLCQQLARLGHKVIVGGMVFERRVIDEQ